MFPLSCERQEGESWQAYAAFCLYRDLGPGRSVDAAYTVHLSKGRREGGERAANGPLKNAPGRWWRWSAENDWKERVLAFDEEREREEREAAAETRRQEVEAYRLTVVDGARRRAATANVLLDKALKRLESIDPETIPVTSLPNFVKGATAAWAEAVRLEGVALGLLDESGNEPEGDL